MDIIDKQLIARYKNEPQPIQPKKSQLGSDGRYYSFTHSFTTPLLLSSVCAPSAKTQNISF